LRAEAGLRAKTAADVIGEDAHLVMRNGKALGDQLGQMKHRLRRDVHRQALAVEARYRGMRLEAGMLLRGGAERRLEQQGIPRIARAADPVARLLGLLRERRRGAAQIALPWRGPAGAFGNVAGLL